MIAAAIAKHLDAHVTGCDYRPSTSGGNVTLDWMPESPDLAVAVMTQPGLPQKSKLAYDLPGIQVIVRGKPRDPRSSHDLAAAIHSELTCLDAVTLDDAGPDEVYVVGCTPLQSSPVPMGRDINERLELSLNFSLHTRSLTTHRL